MKKMYFLLVLLHFFSVHNGLYSQANPEPCYTQKLPLSKPAYNKMMRQHYNFTIMGTQTPSTGFKIETNKPTITLKGNVNSPENEHGLLVNVELTGGVQNDILQLFAGDQLNSFFKASVGFNKMLTSGNEARFLRGGKFTNQLTRKKVCGFKEEITRQIDTLLVLAAFESYVTDLNVMVNAIVTDSKRPMYNFDDYPRSFARLDDANYEDRADAYYRKLIVGLIEHYGADKAIVDSSVRYKQFIADLKNKGDRKLKSTKILSDLSKLISFSKNETYKDNLFHAHEIETYKDIWTSKRITWLNVSISGTNSTFKLHDVGLNTLSDGKSFLPAVSVTYNVLIKWKAAHKYFYLRTGGGVKRVNSLVDLTKFDYKKETIINVTPTETLKTEKSGTAYQGVLEHGVGVEIPIEVFWCPWSTGSVPGFYSKLQYSYGFPWINKNKLSADLGIVWNLVNSEKESKNVLTIVPYMTWANLVQEYKDAAKTQSKKLSEQFSIGVKFGIPVNLGK